MAIDVLSVPNILDFNAELKLQGFKVYPIDTLKNVVRSYNRKDFYKICVITGHNIIQYSDKGFEVKGTTLFFGNPMIPYSWENISQQTGYTCLFSENFLKAQERSESLQESPLFKIGGSPIFSLTDQQRDFVEQLFQRMLTEQNTEYQYRDDLIRNYINLVIHEALKLQPAETMVKHKDASSRIAIQFLDLLERQFPIEHADQALQLKTAQGFAEKLSVHVNHLNRSVKQVTGKSTTTHISERIITEAKALLQYTDWTVSQIAYGLGFEYPTYFNNFFKKMTGSSPTSFRP
jgi:AraC family transcriptional regulator, transcriptional activator of pobA